MKAGSGSKLDRPSLSRSLLGSDVFVEIGRARRVPPKRCFGKEGPLLNCTSESRRRAQAGEVVADPEDCVPSGESTARLRIWWLFAASSAAAWCAIAPKFEAAMRMAAALFLVAWLAALRAMLLRRAASRRGATARRKALPTSNRLPSCWASSERTPPLPLLELPASIEDVQEDWMVEAGVAPRWSPAERRFLARARSTFAAELSDVPPYLDAYGDRRMLRFLRMDPRLDEDRAIEKVGTYLAWRREAKADQMRALVPERGSDPRDWPHGDILLDCIRVLQCSDQYFSKRGHAVTVYQAFHWPARALRAKVGGMTSKQLVDFATFGAEYNAVQMERISVSRERVLLDHAKQIYLRRKHAKKLDLDDDDDFTPLQKEGWGEITRLCAITDMAGCTFASMIMPQLVPAVVQAVSIFVQHYPFIVGELHVINCVPIVAKMFRSALRTVVPKHIADQVQVHVLASELLTSVTPGNLPAQIGGNAECPQLEPPSPPPSDVSSPLNRNTNSTEDDEDLPSGNASRLTRGDGENGDDHTARPVTPTSFASSEQGQGTHSPQAPSLLRGNKSAPAALDLQGKSESRSPRAAHRTSPDAAQKIGAQKSSNAFDVRS